jgi:hypothetical protein
MNSCVAISISALDVDRFVTFDEGFKKVKNMIKVVRSDGREL